MRLKDILNRVKNKSNNQSVWNPKKRMMKEIDISEDELLNMKLDSLLKRSLD